MPSTERFSSGTSALSDGWTPWQASRLRARFLRHWRSVQMQKPSDLAEQSNTRTEKIRRKRSSQQDTVNQVLMYPKKGKGELGWLFW